MRLYSDLPRPRALQIAGDVVAVIVLALGGTAAIGLHAAIASLGTIGSRVAQSGNGFASTLGDIGKQLGGVPLIGGGIRAPFDAASGAGTTLAEAGSAWTTGVERIATLAGWTVALLVVLLVVAGWVRPRLGGALRRGAVARLAQQGANLDLLALRALVNRPADTLTTVHPDVVAAWRSGDQDVIRALAAVELRSAGIRLP